MTEQDAGAKPDESSDAGEKPAEGSGGGNPPAESDAGATSAASEKESSESLLKALRSERKARQDAEKRAKTLEDEKLSELERVTKERDEAAAERDKLRADLSDRDLGAELEKAAAAGGAKDGRAGAVARLIDRTAIERDDDGKPLNLEKLVEAARGAAPELFEAKTPRGDAEGGARAAGPDTGGMNRLIREAAGH